MVCRIPDGLAGTTCVTAPLPLEMAVGARLTAVILAVLFDALLFGHFTRAVIVASTLHKALSFQ